MKKILDFSSGQFKIHELPVYVFGGYEEYHIYKREIEDDGFSRFVKLLRKYLANTDENVYALLAD